jgi:hypothetical protein
MMLHLRYQFVFLSVAAATLVLLVAASNAYAQGATSTATLQGRVFDSTGGVLPGVTVTIVDMGTNQSRTVVTNEQGVYRFAGLTPGRYTVSGELQGFAKFVQPNVALNVGAAVDIDIRLQVSTVAETITVTTESPVIETAKTALTSVISREQIDTLPTNNRNYLDFALLTPGVAEDVRTAGQGIGLKFAGARGKEGSLLVDGLWNTDESFTFAKVKYSQDAIAEFQVVNIGAAPEFGRAIGGIVSAVTKSGSNDLSGSGYGYFRNKTLNAQDFLSKQQGLEKSDFDRQQWGGSIGGPLVHNKTFYFGAADRATQDTPYNNGILSSDAATIGLPAADVGNINQYLNDTFAMGKITHVINANNTIAGQYAMTFDVISNFQAAFGSRSRTGKWDSTDHTLQAQWTSVAHGGNWLHELRGGYMPRRFHNTNRDEGGPPLTADGQLRSSLAPSVSIQRVANFGGGYVLLDMFTKPFQAVYSSTIFKNSHSFKLGADVMGVNFVYLRYQGPQSGTYTFPSLDAYLRGQYTTYTQSFGPPGLGRYHTYIAAYAQDSWTISKRATLNYGLRWDGDAITDYREQAYGNDFNNFGPRAALSLDVTGSGTTLLKVGGGLFFDRLWQNPITPTYYNNQFVGQQTSATWRLGQLGAPVYPQTFPGEELPANAPVGIQNVYIVPTEVEIPQTWQVVATLEHALTSQLSTSISVVSTTSHHKEMLIDTNLVWGDPANPDGLCCFARVNPNFRQINQYRYDGEARYLGLVVSADQRMRHGLRLGANATLARSRDQNENWNTQLNDARYPDRDYGPNGDTPIFSMSANGAYDFNNSMQASFIFHARSGLAIDAKVGPNVDVNGDGNFNDRTPGLPRNDFRGPWVHSLDARFTWTLPIAGGRTQFTAEGFNLYNRANYRTLETLYGVVAGSPNPAFGSALTYYSPREVQLGLRFQF